MRIVHSADWHLGRIFHGIYLTEDQGYLLDELYGLLKDTRADGLLIAGDIYDRAIPPPGAVSLLDDFLYRLLSDLDIEVIIIAGNHDSPHRLGFGSRIFEQHRLHVSCNASTITRPIVLTDKHGEIYFYPVPYCDPSEVRILFGDDAIKDHNQAMGRLIGAINESHPPGKRSVLITHAFVRGGTSCDSERPLTMIGGADQVDPGILGGFDYVALGHLHRPQSVGGNQNIQYSGSLMKYSFDEAHHKKSVSLVEIKAKGDYSLERITLNPRRDVRIIEGYFKDILAAGASDQAREDYIQVILKDELPGYDLMGRLREVYPNALSIRKKRLEEVAAQIAGMDKETVCLDPKTLFRKFYSEIHDSEPSKEELDEFSRILDRIIAIQKET